MKKSPPGWSPHKVISRNDGWVIDPENEDRIPRAAAEMILAAMPSFGDTVPAIKARMVARHRALEHRRKRQRAIVKRMAQSRHA